MNLLCDIAARPVIGHRGAAAYAPENTLASLQLAPTLGAEAVEFDVRASSDGVAMVFHDPTLDRTTNLTGPVGARSAAELAAADAGYHFINDAGALSYRGSGICVPTLAQVIEALPGLPLLIEIKEAAVSEAVARTLLEHEATGRAVVAGNDWRWLGPFAAAPFQLGASRRDITRAFFGIGAPHPACRVYSVPERWHRFHVPSRRFIAAARRRGATTHVWTVDDAKSALAWWRNGANGIVSNRPDVIRVTRDAFNAGL